MKKEYTEPMITVISLVANTDFAVTQKYENPMSKNELFFGEDDF